MTWKFTKRHSQSVVAAILFLYCSFSIGQSHVTLNIFDIEIPLPEFYSLVPGSPELDNTHLFTLACAGEEGSCSFIAKDTDLQSRDPVWITVGFSPTEKISELASSKKYRLLNVADIDNLRVKEFSITIDVSGTIKSHNFTMLYDNTRYLTILANQHIRDQVVGVIRELKNVTK